VGGVLVNFLDVGGGLKVEVIMSVVEVIFFDKKVMVVFFNIFGGIICCDEVVCGLIEVFD